jgi:PRTRC genetic system protein E
VFTEVIPLLVGRTVLITVACEGDTAIRVNVCPKRTTESENVALSTSLSFVRMPEELDRDFGVAFAEYVYAHQRLGTTLAQANAEMEAAAKAAQEEGENARPMKHGRRRL